MQKAMYPAQVNSRQTEIAAAIDAMQVTIPLVDASLVPDAPNLLTIGTDESAETILYTGKSGNDLTGVTRGFQGTADSWAVGTKVARYFTAYDHDSLVNNVGELQTDVAGAATKTELQVLDDEVTAHLAENVQQTTQGIYELSGSGFPRFTKNATNPVVLGNAQTQDQAGFSTVICTDGIIASPINKFYMYWAGHDGGGIWLSTAPHPLGPWTTHGQVITDRSMYDSQSEYDNQPGPHISSPEVIFMPELNILRMYFHRAFGGQFTEYCHSANGLTWTKQPGRITTYSLDGSWNENETSYLRVVRLNEVYYATYQGRDRRANVKGLGFGISNDGITFKWSDMPLFYNTQFKDEYTPHADLGGAPCLVNLKGQLWVFFGDGVTNRTIKASPVNDPFERYPLVKSVLLSTETWEGGMVESPNCLYHEGYLYMYYNGQNPDRKRAIGVSYFKLGLGV